MAKSKLLRLVSIILLLIVAVSCTSKKEKVEDFVSRGNRLMEKSDPVRAVLEYRNALQLDPKNSDVLLLLGRAYLAEKQYRKAFSAFKTAVNLDPKLDAARVEMVRLLLLARQGKKALEQLDKITKPVQFEPDITILRAKALILEKQYGQAIEVLSRSNIQGKEKQMLLSICFKETGQIDKMMDALKRWRNLDPKGPGSYLFMVKFDSEKGRKDAAARELEKMVAANPSSLKLQLLQANLLEQLGFVDRAAEIYEKLPAKAAMNKAKADFYIRHRRAQDAILVLEELIRKNPKDIDVLVKLSEAFALLGNMSKAQDVLGRAESLQLDWQNRKKLIMAEAKIKATEGKLDEAQALCEKILHRDQAVIDAHLLLGKILLQKGELDKAEVHLNQVVAATPLNARAQILLARCQMLNNKQAMARDTLHNALQKNPSNEGLRLALVRYEIMQKDYSQALDLLKKGLAINDKSILLLRAAGDIEAAVKNFEKAEEYYRRIMEIRPDSPLGYMEMGRLMLSQNRSEEALTWFQRAYKSKNGWQLAIPAMAGVYVRKGEVDAALKVVGQEANKRPTAPSLYFYLGRIYAMKGDLNNSEKAYSKAIKLSPRWLPPYQGLARIYVQQGRIEKAILRFEKLYQDSPSFSTAMTLAALYESRGDYKNAIDIYEAVRKKYGDTPFVLNNLAYLYAEYSNSKKELENGREMIRKVIASNSTNANFLDTAGWLDYRLGALDAAWEYLQDAVSKAPDTGIIQLHCAIVAHELGLAKQAAHHLERAIEQGLDPNARKRALNLKREWSSN